MHTFLVLTSHGANHRITMLDSKLFSEISVLYEDSHLLAVNKPSGLMVHGDARTSEPTLTDWLLEKYPKIASVGEPMTLQDGTKIERPGIVHRLDKETSGVLLVAKTPEAFAHLKKQFQDRKTSKTYHAFVYGVVKEDRGVINRPIGKSKNDPRLWSAQRGARGTMRDAVTEYRVLRRGTDASYLEIFPKTGRTHQIRVHLKAVNHPVVCDRLYAPKREPLLGFNRLALHALRLSFTDVDGTERTVEAPLPEDFLWAEKEMRGA